MTVSKLIEELQKLPATHEVVVDRYSEYAIAEKAELIVGFDNGGYISSVHNPSDTLRAHGYVFIG